MFSKILGTVGTRLLAAILAFATWTLNARMLGPEKVGTVSLIIFSVAIVHLFTNFIAGSALIYYTPRHGANRLFLPAYAGAVILSIAASSFLWMTGKVIPVAGVIPEGYFPHVLVLALVMSLASANTMLLLGTERIRASNTVSLVQVISLFAILLLMLFVAGNHGVMAYYLAILLSQVLAFVIGLILLKPHPERVAPGELKPMLKELMRFGTYVQVANIFQAMNYRLSLKFTDYFLGRGAVGILSLGMQLAEGLWLISRSIAVVQYSRLANETDPDYGVRLTLTLAKVSLAVTGLAMLVVVAIPASWFALVFSAGFGDVKTVIVSLSVGIVVLSVSMVLSGYFSAINRPVHNMIGSAVGFVFTVILGFVLVPRLGLPGAGIAASISYAAVTLYQVVVFIRKAGVRPVDFLITRRELKLLAGEVKKMAHR